MTSRAPVLEPAGVPGAAAPGTPATFVSFVSVRCAITLPLDLEERRSQDETRGEQQDQAGGDDANQRPDLRPGRGALVRGLQVLRQDPGEEPGGSEGEYADGHRVPGACEDAAPVVDDSGERGENVEGPEQLAAHVDHVAEGILNRRGEQVHPGEPDDEQADDDAG